MLTNRWIVCSSSREQVRRPPPDPSAAAAAECQSVTGSRVSRGPALRPVTCPHQQFLQPRHAGPRHCRGPRWRGCAGQSSFWSVDAKEIGCSQLYTSIFNVNPKPHHSLEHFVNRYIANNRKRAQENMWSVLIYEGTLFMHYWYCQCLCPLSSSCRSQNPVPIQQLPLTTILIITTLIQ